MAQYNDLRPCYLKDGQGTHLDHTAGTKQVKEEMLSLGQTSDIGEAPPSRVYSRDYSKRDPDGDQRDDTLSVFLGNPLAL